MWTAFLFGQIPDAPKPSERRRIMKISSIQLNELPSGEAVLQCPQCRATWHSNRGSGLTPCNCIRFLWSSSELGEANLGSPADFDRTEFENAYRQRHWSVYQDDDIVDGDLGAPDPYVLEQLTVSGVDEAIFYPEIPGPESLGSTRICIGLRHTKGEASRRKKTAACKGRAGVSLPQGRLLKAPAWASSFLGRRFAVESARSEGWVDQASNQAHFGVPSGPGIWLFKLGQADGGHHCARGRIWWRFLLVKLSTNGKIRTIYTRVDEVFPDGHGEFCTNDLLPHDITEALEALGAAAPDHAPTAAIN
jgi:hypothetical protein